MKIIQWAIEHRTRKSSDCQYSFIEMNGGVVRLFESKIEAEQFIDRNWVRLQPKEKQILRAEWLKPKAVKLELEYHPIQ